MAQCKPIILTTPTACSMAQDLFEGKNVGDILDCLCRVDNYTLELLEASGIEKQVEKYINEESMESCSRYVSEKMKMVREEAETKMVEAPVRGLKRKMEAEVDNKPIYRIPKKKRAEETAEIKKEEKKDVSTEELARRLKALPRKPTNLDAMKLIRSLGSYSATQIEEAEVLIGRKMQRVEEVWILMIFIKFGFAKGENKNDPRKLYFELLEKEKKKTN